MTRSLSRHRAGRMHVALRRGARLAAAAALFSVAACSGLGDVLAPGEPGTLPARFALDVQVPRFQTSSFQRVELTVQPSYESSTGFVPLGAPFTVVLTAAGEQPVSLPIDLGPCLADAARVRPDNLADRCAVRLALTLLGDGRPLDQTTAGPFVLAPGGTTTSTTPVVLREVGTVVVDGPGRLGNGPVPLLTGASAQLTVEARDASGRPLSGRTFTWTSSNTTIATVSATGQVLGVAPGTATITATTGDRSGSVEVLIRPPFEPLSVEAATGIVVGTVTVTSSPAGILCTLTPSSTTGTCEADFERGSSVTLSAAVGAETVFERWTTNGGCAPSDLGPTCQVTVPEGGRAVVVTTDQLRTVRVRPTSSNTSLSGLPAVGRVTDLDGYFGNGCDMSGLSFGGACDAQVPSRRSVRLVATPTAPTVDADFDDLDICDQQTIGLGAEPATCTILPPHGAITQVDVFFRGPERLTVGGSGPGTGRITAPGDPDIDCRFTGSSNAGACTSSYAAGTLVTVTAAPEAGSRFVGWRVDGALEVVLGTSLQLAIDRPRSAVAVFEPDLQTLTINILAGSGTGSITVNGTTVCSVSLPLESNLCQVQYPLNTQVIIAAVATTGSIHELWQDDCSAFLPEFICGGAMDRARTATARFAQAGNLSYGIVDSNFEQAPAEATVRITSPGRRTYTCTKTAGGLDFIFCGTVPLPVGALISVEVLPGSASEFLGFSGEFPPPGCTGESSPNPCVFTMPAGNRDLDAIIADFGGGGIMQSRSGGRRATP